jgi:hypothetical protein
MIDYPAQPAAHDPFWFRECFVMSMPIGKMASNLRELLHALRELDESVLYYHLWQSRLTIAPPGLEYTNDFAFWAGTALQDSKLAEILSSFDPFGYESIEQVRDDLVDLLDDYLWNLPSVPWARPGFEFHFCEASTVVLRSQVAAATLAELHSALKKVGLDSVYYHLIDARWRLRPRRMDDISIWIETNFGLPDLVSAIRGIDIAFFTLEEIRNTVLSLASQYVGAPDERTE